MGWYHWLVANGLWRDLLTWVLFTTLTLALTGVKLRAHLRNQKKIADRLNTGTPGGLTDVVRELERVVAALEEHNRLTKHADGE